jgi:hypothetical protein
VKSTIEAICTHSNRRRPPTYGEASAELSRFLCLHSLEGGMGPLLHGLARWVGAHIGGSSTCYDYALPGELFSERKVEFTENFCRLLCHFGTLVTISDKDFNECDFVWRFRPHFSDKYSIRVSRRISRVGLNRGTSSRGASRHPGTLVASTALRENINGQHDNLYNYTINVLLCPIL